MLSQCDFSAVEVDEVVVPAPGFLVSGTRSGHYLYRIHAGQLRVQSQAQTLTACPGDLVWIGAGNERCIEALSPAAWTILRLRNRLFAMANAADAIAWQALLHLARFTRATPRLPLSSSSLQSIDTCLQAIKDAGTHPAHACLVLRKASVLQLLMAVVRDFDDWPAAQNPAQRRARTLLHSALLLIEEQHHAIADAKALARKVGISRSALYRLCTDFHLAPPHRLLEKARIEAAANRLIASDDDVLSISLQCGFHSLSAFYRAFQNAFAQSPARFRRTAHTKASRT